MLVDLAPEHQAVILPRGRFITYDVMVLATGLQDSAAARLGALDYKVGRMCKLGAWAGV